MEGFNYSQVVSMICYYLERYPHVGVALECVLEEVEGDGKMANQVLSALNKINEGEKDFEVLRAWGVETGSRDLNILSDRIEEGHAKKEDIGFYVRRFMPSAALSGNKDKDKEKPYKKKFNKNRKNFNNKKNYRN